MQRSQLPFSAAADRHFATNTPWLWWTVGLLVVGAMLPAVRAGSILPIRVAEADGRLREMASIDYPVSVLDRLSQVLGIAGIALIVSRGGAGST